MSTIRGRFAPPKKGENHELRTDLNSEYREKRKDAIKRVIANMTIGKDVSGLFPDVLKNMQTEDLEQKKLVYLYLINYAKTQPELVILAVNTFVKDTDDPNPLIRALAIRTMGCLRADKIIDYLADPLRKCLHDESPYVKKTAALCAAKLFDLKPDLALEGGVLEILQELTSDSNPMVVANAVSALTEIYEQSNSLGNPLRSSAVLQKLLVALNECTEWGRIAILSALADIDPADIREAEQICERVTPQFQHANGAVVLSAIKVIMKQLHLGHSKEFLDQLRRKMTPPLVTLVSAAPEVQYVALRNISLILQEMPDLLSQHIGVFFCKFNDPPYVKHEKLEIMIKLASENNIDLLLSELKEYASEVDIEFSRRAARAIGQCALLLPLAAERCMATLLEILALGVHYVVQEVMLVLKDVLRKYPTQFHGVLPDILAVYDSVDEPDAKSAFIWIVGEYGTSLPQTPEILAQAAKGFVDEAPQVQLQIVGAIVKQFMQRPNDMQAYVQKVLQSATTECDNADIRDRAYIYWRLLSSDPAVAKSIINANKPSIQVSSETVSPTLLQELLADLGSLASVYHLPAASFVKARAAIRSEIGLDQPSLQPAGSNPLQTVVQGNVENLLDLDFGGDYGPSSDPPLAARLQAEDQPTGTIGGGMGNGGIGLTTMNGSNPNATLDDLLGLFGQTSLSSAQSLPSGTAELQTSSRPDLLF